MTRRPFASKVRYAVSALGEDGKPLPYFPTWEQDEHPFYVREGKIRGTLRNGRVLLQSADAWTQKGGIRERRQALESICLLQEAGRPAPTLRLPDTARSVSVRALGGIPGDGLLWGRWELESQPVHELSVSLPEGWEPTPELDAWARELATSKGVESVGWLPGVGLWNRVRDFALQPWRMDLFLPHEDWYFDWEKERGAEGRITGRSVPSCLYLRWRELAPFPPESLECDLFSMALATSWLEKNRIAHQLPENLPQLPENAIIHIVGMNLNYVNAKMVKSQYMGGK